MNTRLVPLTTQIVGDTRRPVLLLLASVLVVLLIGCANVANLLLARSLARERELSLRAALGAAGSRVAQQLLTESVVLAALGGAGGLAIAWLGVRAIALFGPANVPRLRDIALDAPIVAFAIGLAFVAGILFGVVPAARVVGGISGAARDAAGRVEGDRTNRASAARCSPARWRSRWCS